MKLKKFNGSKDYNKLNHLPFNRKFSVRPGLMKSMNEYGFIVPIHLIETDLFDGKKQIYIADGQNRALTAANLDIDFYGYIDNRVFNSKEELVTYVSNLNSNQKKWSVDDYVKAFSYLNFDAYAALLKLKSKVPFSISTLSALLHSNGTYNSRDAIITGELAINYLDETNYSLRLAAKLSKYETFNSRMLLSLQRISSLKKFNESKFTKAYIKSVDEIKTRKKAGLDNYRELFTSWF